MKHFFIGICISLLGEVTLAQDGETISVKGDEISEFITRKGYKYPSFQKATVYFKNATPAAGMVNYNYLLQTIQFLGDKGDTLVIADETGIDYVAAGADTFYYDHGFFERIFAVPQLRLAVRHSLKANGEPQKLGAFGIPSATGGITSEGTTRNTGNVLTLAVNEVYIFTKKTRYYVSKNNQPFQELNKKSITRLFPQHGDHIIEYLKKHQINFDKEMDVLALFGFIGRLFSQQGTAR